MYTSNKRPKAAVIQPAGLEFKKTLEKFRLEYKAVHSQNEKAIKALHCDEDFEVIQEKSVPKERWIRALGIVLFRITLYKVIS